MGCCSHNRLKCEEANLIQDEGSILKEKIEKVFRFNPLHKYGSRRQSILIKEFHDYQIKNRQKNLFLSYFCGNKDKNIKPENSHKIFDLTDKKILKFTYELLQKYLINFVNSELLFLHIILFVLSNTKNNIDHKQDIINEIINDVFFLNKDERTINMVKLKRYIKSLIYICLMIFINFVILNVFKNKKDIDKLLNDEFLIDDKYDKFKITEYVFEKIQMGLSQHHSFSKLVTTWEDYLLGPIIFAGYSNEKNISNYNLKLKEKIIRRLADIFDSDKIIRSIVKKEIEIPMEVNEE